MKYDTLPAMIAAHINDMVDSTNGTRGAVLDASFSSLIAVAMHVCDGNETMVRDVLTNILSVVMTSAPAEDGSMKVTLH
jgi:hypothetical protein